MSARDHHTARGAPDWSRPSQAFRHMDGSLPRASGDAWRSAPAVRREYERGLRNGWIGCSAFYTIGTVLLVLVFHFLGVH